MSRYSAPELINKMRQCADSMDKILKDNSLKADVQISDIDCFCWAMVELALSLQSKVRTDLFGVEDEE